MRFRFSFLLGVVLIIGCFQNPGQLFREAEQTSSEGNFQGAVALYSKLIRKYPNSPFSDRSLFRLGETYLLNLDDDRNALKYFQKIAEDSNNRDLKYQANVYMADIFLQSFRNYDLAIIQYQKLINEYGTPSTDDDNQFKIAECYLLKGDCRQAIVEYHILLEKYPASNLVMDAKFQMANCFYMMGNCGEALDRYQALLDQNMENPYSIDIQFGIGSCKEEQGDYQEAIRIFQKIKDQYPNRELLEMKIESLKNRV